MAAASPPLSPDDRARLEELFAPLEDRSADVPPITPREFAQRRDALARHLAADGLDALVVEPGTTLWHFSGVEWGLSARYFALVVTAGGEDLWLVPAFEEQRARLLTGADGERVVTWQEHEDPCAVLVEALRARGLSRLAVDPWMRHAFAQRLAELWGAERVLLGREPVLELRARKGERELALLGRAQELTQQALLAVADTLEPGVTSTEIGHRLTVAQERLGLGEVWHLVLIGPAGAFPHGDGLERVLVDGAPILIDTGARLHGYCSDCTRSWVQGGRPGERYRGLWRAVRDAQCAARDAVRPGRPAGELDALAREELARAGLGSGYAACGHRLGHGIGLDGHEAPYLVPHSPSPVAEGMTFSLEPGVYLPGELGLRIEDIVAVTADGARVFGREQAGPESPHPA